MSITVPVSTAVWWTSWLLNGCGLESGEVGCEIKKNVFSL